MGQNTRNSSGLETSENKTKLMDKGKRFAVAKGGGAGDEQNG